MDHSLAHTLLPLVGVCVTIALLFDCYNHARQERKVLWLVLIAITGLIGWLIFWLSGDREAD